MTKPSKKTKLKVRINKEKRRKSIEERTIDGSEFIEDFDEKVEHYVEDYVDKVARTKQLTLISGVGFFMLLILSFYVYNFKFQIASLANEDENDLSIANQVDLIKENVGEIVDNYKDIKETINTEIEGVEVAEDNSSGILDQKNINLNSLPQSDTTNKDDTIEILKEKLLENTKE